MVLSSLLFALVMQASPAPGSTDSIPVAPVNRREPVVDARLVPGIDTSIAADTIPRKRPRAVTYSDAYYTRLQIHRFASYTELPLFAGEWWLGNKLLSTTEAPGRWVKPTHAGVAAALGGLFFINTVTGAWNLYDSRNSTDDKAIVWSHTALMLASDAGFAITGMLAGDAHRTINGRNRHKNAAIVSMGLATLGTGIMWVARGF